MLMWPSSRYFKANNVTMKGLRILSLITPKKVLGSFPSAQLDTLGGKYNYKNALRSIKGLYLGEKYYH